MTKRKVGFPKNLDANPDDKTDRLIGLSDGIYAFAMTLLAVNVDLPQLAANANPEQVTDAVLELVPQLIIYVTSFLLVALYWQISRRTFRYIAKSDDAITWLTILQLLLVAFLPVATGLFDTYGRVSAVVLLYAGTLTGIGISGQLLWFHARRADLLAQDLNPITLDYYSFRGTVTTTIFALAMVVGIVAVDYARWVLILLLLLTPFLRYFFRWWYRITHKEN